MSRRAIEGYVSGMFFSGITKAASWAISFLQLGVGQGLTTEQIFRELLIVFDGLGDHSCLMFTFEVKYRTVEYCPVTLYLL